MPNRTAPCSCSNEDCPRHGICAECQAFHHSHPDPAKRKTGCERKAAAEAAAKS